MNLITTRTWINLALMSLVIVLALIVYLRPGRTPVRVEVLTPLSPSTIKSITIKRAARQDIELQRRADTWWLTSPIGIAANRARVNTLLKLANTPTFSSYPADTLDLAQYGLSDTLVTVVLDTQPIVLGGINPINERRYLMIADKVYLVRDDLYDVYSADIGSYVSNRLLPAGAKIIQLTLPELRLKRIEGGRWDMQGARVSELQAQALIDAWEQVSALWVGDYNEQTAESEVALALENGESLRLLVVSTNPELILARPDLALEYHLPEQALEKLLRIPEPIETADDG